MAVWEAGAAAGPGSVTHGVAAAAGDGTEGPSIHGMELPFMAWN